ncbi:MAG: squalene synthase HpnC [Pseudolabrys sp.]|nr:squalene synthase HpnC [Pseudolabrys sp.]
MKESTQFRSGKGHRDENFPVASWLIRPQHRSVILAFYEFVRTADDISDHPRLSAGDKLARLDRLESSLLGKDDQETVGVALRESLRERQLTAQHALDLLSAFRQDVTKLRYTNWDDLIDYCSRSAMPVGRFVLDVHGESRTTWPASDALCAALQIINHLQDCATDYRALNRVYLPLDALALHAVDVSALAESRASPSLRICLHALAARTAQLLAQSRPLPHLVSDARLAMEIAVIQRLAARLVVLLQRRDPLSERVHLARPAALTLGIGAVAGCLLGRLLRVVTTAERLQTP